MAKQTAPLELTFLGSGNAFGAGGRAFGSFVVNGRYLFDCGPTLLQQLRKVNLTTHDIDVILISHFHADHFFGLPFFFLDAWRNSREHELTVVGPRDIKEKLFSLLHVGYPMIPGKVRFPVNFVEVEDGSEGEASGLRFRAASVVHVPELECFAYYAETGGRSVAFSGDSTFCEGIGRAVAGAEVVVLECSCGVEPVHMNPDDVARVRAEMMDPGAALIVTHLDGHDGPGDFDGMIVAADATRYCF